jgi:hypothetical protein
MEKFEKGESAGIASAMAREIMYQNDDWTHEAPEQRWHSMRAWVEERIKT